mmetsp:Transcript_52108/g.127225  ORF Transcript_52108/g.127225 Transcript_52108/m.127225 type:complete len:257 (+) Transcript_52108:66-836(+)
MPSPPPAHPLPDQAVLSGSTGSLELEHRSAGDSMGRSVSIKSSMSVKSFFSLRHSLPPSPATSTTHAHSATCPPIFSTSSHAPMRVAPVASMSSMISTLAPFRSASSCISSLSLPKHACPMPDPSIKSTPTLLHGSFPGFLKGTNGTPRANATGAAKMNPLHSIPTTAVIPLLLYRSTKTSMQNWKASGFPMRKLRSLKFSPGLGKLGTIRTQATTLFFDSSASSFDLTLKDGALIITCSPSPILLGPRYAGGSVF